MAKARKKEDKRTAIANEIWGLLLLLSSVFLAISLFAFHPENYPLFSRQAGGPAHESTGLVGTYLAQYLVFALGRSAVSIPILLFFWSCSFFLQRIPKKKVLKFAGFLIFTVAAACFFAVLGGEPDRFRNGGMIGFFFAEQFENYFGSVGDIFISLFLLILSFVLATEFLVFPLVKIFFGFLGRLLTTSGVAILRCFEFAAKFRFHLPKLPALRMSEEQTEREKRELAAILKRAARLTPGRRKAPEAPEDEEKAPSLFREPPPALKIRTYAKTYSSSDAPRTDEEALKEHERRKKVFENFLKKRPKASEETAQAPLRPEAEKLMKESKEAVTDEEAPHEPAAEAPAEAAEEGPADKPKPKKKK